MEPDLLCKSGVSLMYLSVTKVDPIKSQLGTEIPEPSKKLIISLSFMITK